VYVGRRQEYERLWPKYQEAWLQISSAVHVFADDILIHFFRSQMYEVQRVIKGFTYRCIYMVILPCILVTSLYFIFMILVQCEVRSRPDVLTCHVTADEGRFERETNHIFSNYPFQNHCTGNFPSLWRLFTAIRDKRLHVEDTGVLYVLFISYIMILLALLDYDWGLCFQYRS
jgi:hypothetical protein